MTVVKGVIRPVIGPVLVGVVGDGQSPSIPIVPPAANTLLYFGQADAVTPGDNGELGFNSFVPAAGETHRFTITDLVAGFYVHIRVPTAIEISTLEEVFLGVPNGDVLGNWTKVEDYGTIGGVSYDSYTRGPIATESAGGSIQYEALFAAGA